MYTIFSMCMNLFFYYVILKRKDSVHILNPFPASHSRQIFKLDKQTLFVVISNFGFVPNSTNNRPSLCICGVSCRWSQTEMLCVCCVQTDVVLLCTTGFSTDLFNSSHQRNISGSGRPTQVSLFRRTTNTTSTRRQSIALYHACIVLVVGTHKPT